MSKRIPICPYCGSYELTLILDAFLKKYYFGCRICGATSPLRGTKNAALDAALKYAKEETK